jgi:hypothetical protein
LRLRRSPPSSSTARSRLAALRNRNHPWYGSRRVASPASPKSTLVWGPGSRNQRWCGVQSSSTARSSRLAARRNRNHPWYGSRRGRPRRHRNQPWCGVQKSTLVWVPGCGAAGITEINLDVGSMVWGRNQPWCGVHVTTSGARHFAFLVDISSPKGGTGDEAQSIRARFEDPLKANGPPIHARRIDSSPLRLSAETDHEKRFRFASVLAYCSPDGVVEAVSFPFHENPRNAARILGAVASWRYQPPPETRSRFWVLDAIDRRQ